MIEVITATALLAVTVSGFLMMSGANAALLAKEHRMGRMNYERERQQAIPWWWSFTWKMNQATETIQR